MTELTEDQIAIRDMTRNFVRKDVAPFAAEWDRRETMAPDGHARGWSARSVRRLRLRPSGVAPVPISSPTCWRPRSWPTATPVSATWSAPPTRTASRCGTTARQIRSGAILGRSPAESLIACMLLTEPHAGSDAANIKTRAVRRATAMCSTGTKTFVTSGASRLACIIAVTDPAAGKHGISRVSDAHGPSWLPRRAQGAQARPSQQRDVSRSRSRTWRSRPRTCWGSPARVCASPCRGSTVGASRLPRRRSGLRGPRSMRHVAYAREREAFRP